MDVDLSCCRICLKTEDVMFPIFSTNGLTLSTPYSKMINECTNLKVKIDDNLPSQICSHCTTDLETSYGFKMLAENTNLILMRKLKLENVENKIQFNDLDDIKKKLCIAGLDSKPAKVDFTIEILKDVPCEFPPRHENFEIGNTVIRKIKTTARSKRSVTANNYQDNYVMDDDFVGSDRDDSDYEPPILKNQKKSILTVKPNPSRGQVDIHIKKFSRKKAIPIRDRQSKYLPLYKYNLDDNGNPKVVKPEVRPKKYPYSIKNLGKTLKGSTVPPQARPVKEKHVCPVCGILTYGLGTHLLTHEDIKPYTCEHCGKSFVQKANYKNHIKSHSSTKDQICEICGAAFHFAKSVIRHKLIHKGERPFACTLCSKRFIARCDLNRHMKVHAGYKPFKCTECSMAFNAKHQLNNHLRMHTGEKPFSCEVCNVAFTYKVNLNNHVFKVHGLNIKFKSIHKVTPEILSQQYQLLPPPPPLHPQTSPSPSETPLY